MHAPPHHLPGRSNFQSVKLSNFQPVELSNRRTIEPSNSMRLKTFQRFQLFQTIDIHRRLKLWNFHAVQKMKISNSEGFKLSNLQPLKLYIFGTVCLLVAFCSLLSRGALCFCNERTKP